MSSIEPLSSDFGSRPVTELGPGLGTGWDWIQAWDQTAVGSRPGDMLDSVPGPYLTCWGSDLGTGLIRCQVWDLTWWGPDLGTGAERDRFGTKLQLGPSKDQTACQLHAWTQVHSGPSLGPRYNHILRHSLWNWSVS